MSIRFKKILFLKLNKIFLTFLIIIVFTISENLKAADITGSQTYDANSFLIVGDQYIFTEDDASAVVTGNISLERSRKLFILNDSERTGNTLTIHFGSTVSTTTNSNTIFTDGADLTIVNSGTINSDSSKAINVSNSDGVSITNNNKGVIKSNNNTILGGAGTGAVNTTINNSGEIYSSGTGQGI